MKKKLLTFLLLFVLIFSFAACSEKETATNDITSEAENDDNNSTPAESETAPSNDENGEQKQNTGNVSDVVIPEPVIMPTELSNNIMDFQVAIGDSVYQFPMWYSDFANLGWQYSGNPDEMVYSSGMRYLSWTSDNDVSVSCSAENMTINASKVSDCILTAITIHSNVVENTGIEVTLAKDIKLNVSTEEDIINAYGTPTSTFDMFDTKTLTYGGNFTNQITLTLDSESTVLQQIEIRNHKELKGGDNSVYYDIPAVSSNYTPPTQLGDDVYDYAFLLEGNYYSLPCPFSALEANGFTISDESKDEVIPSGADKGCYLDYNGKKLSVSMRNFSYFATDFTNCYITNITVMSDTNDFCDLTLSGNIKLGTNEASLLDVINSHEYELYGDEQDKSYYLNQPGLSEYSNRRDFNLVNGIIRQIDISCTKRPE